jgi:DNA end-binding protein Ku
MSEKWKPQQYHDTYREDVMAMIKKKVAAKQTKTITMPEPAAEKPAKAKVIDLVSLLQASLGKKPAPAHAGDDDDDDDDPPPRKSRKPSADEDEDESDAPPPRARKSSSTHSTVHARASAAKKPAAKKTAAKAPAKKAVAKTATAAKTPARRRKAA